MAGIWRKLLLITLLHATAMGVPAQALVPAALQTAAPTTAPEPQIANTAAEGSDERITDRIGDIFSELPSLSGVNVSVNEGVVTLSGQVPDGEAKDRAEAIATRVDGVVTVENSLERDISVDSSLGALSELSDRMSAIIKMLPLIGVALAAAFLIGLFGYLIAGFGALWKWIAPNSFLAELIASTIRLIFVIGGVVVLRCR